MTSPTQNSPTGQPMRKMSEMLPALKAELSKRDVPWNQLAVLILTAGEQVIGVVSDSTVLVGQLVHVSSPRRFIRLQKATPEGLTIDFMIADLDMIEDGKIQVSAIAGYYLHDLSEESQGRYFATLLDHIDMKEQARIKQSGIIMPDGAHPFAMPNLNLRGGRQ